MPYAPRLNAICAFVLIASAASLARAEQPRPASPPPGSASLSIGPAPSWIERVDYDPGAKAPDGATFGIHYLLSDAQERVEPAESYRRLVLRVLTEAGIQSASDISASWDPEYQSIAFHSLRIIRGSEIRDALSPSAFRVVQRETEFERSMYDGRLSALVSLPDVRAGDIIEYSFTVRGRNPVFGGKFSTSYDLAFSSPISRLYCSVVGPASRELRVARLGGAVEPARKTKGRETVIVWDLGPVAASKEEDGSPAWFDARPWVQIEEWENWGEVASWAAKLYSAQGTGNAAVRAEASRIAAANPSPESRTLAAARFVQDEIRYLGIEAGEYSHRPERPDDVLRRRSGDCKGKARLLSAILAELGVRSWPALTDSDYGRGLDGALASPIVFDHVILAIESGEGLVWIDPTMTQQRGKLGSNAIPGCERALLAREGETGLIEIPKSGGRMETTENFLLPALESETGSLVVTTRYEGIKADQMRYTLATGSLKDLEEDYHQFYARIYEGMTVSSPLSFEDDPVSNIISTTETYALPGSFLKVENGESILLKAGTVSGVLVAARDGDRWSPYAIGHPLDIRHVATASPLPNGNFDDARESVKDPAFSFDYEIEYEGEELSATWELKTLKDAVAPDEYPSFAKNIDTMGDLLDYSISWADDTPSGPSSGTKVIIFLLIFALACAVAGCIVLYERVQSVSPVKGSALAPRRADYLDLPSSEAHSLFCSGGLVFLCTLSPEGRYDLTPVAWNCPLDYGETSKLLFVLDTGHASYENVKASGSFIVAIPGARQRDIAERCGAVSARDSDKYAIFGIKAFPGSQVDALVPEGARAWAECALVKIIEEGTSAIVIGEVKAAKALGGWWKDRLHYVKQGVWYAPGRIVAR